jgi:hypothetical protein
MPTKYDLMRFKRSHDEEILYKLEGLHTVETVMQTLGIAKQSANNLISKLKKQQHIKVIGAGRKKRLYKISMKKFRPRHPGMWDILNKYNPNFQLNPWYDHQVIGKYTVEDVIVDAIEKKDFRICLAVLSLYNHIKNWKRLYNLAIKKNLWQEVGALYDVARIYMRVRKMPLRYNKIIKGARWKQLTILQKTYFTEIAKKWKVIIPMNTHDLDDFCSYKV